MLTGGMSLNFNKNWNYMETLKSIIDINVVCFSMQANKDS